MGEPHAYPWQISLQMRQIGVFSHICGGSVIDESTIVCAAHCAVGKTESQVQIVAGAHNIGKDEDSSWQVRKISKLWPHEDYDSNEFTNDISLLNLSNWPNHKKLLKLEHFVKIAGGAKQVMV